MKKNLLIITTAILPLLITAQLPAKTITSQSEKDIIPEGITVDNHGMIYVSSIAKNKIIVIDSNGNCNDFIKSNQDGFLEGLGMKIDNKKQWLWAVSNKKRDKQYESKIYTFDLNTKHTKQQYGITDTVRHLFNDLILHPNGKVYVTDTYGASIYEADPATQKLTVCVKDSLIAYPNGIAVNNKGRIYIATYSHGLMQLDVATKTLTPLKGYADSTAFALDGLVYYNKSIIGIYNGAENNKNNLIIQYFLNDEGDKIINERIIDKGNKLFHEPTTAALLNDKLYVLANSYLAAYNQNKESATGIEDKLGSVTVLVYNLK